jgi:hypothetical protein
MGGRTLAFGYQLSAIGKNSLAVRLWPMAERKRRQDHRIP